jgi:hypothetical protein
MRTLEKWDRRPGALIRRYPVTIGISAIVAGMGLITQHHSRADMRRLMERFGMTWSDILKVRFWPISVSTFMQSDPGFPWLILFFVLTSLFALETLAGSVAALVTFLASDWISSPLTEISLKVLANLGDREARSILDAGSTGSSAAFHGAFAAAAMLLPKRWSKWIVLVMIGVVVFQFAFERVDNAIAHAIATFIGAALAHYVWRPRLEKNAATAASPQS